MPEQYRDEINAIIHYGALGYGRGLTSGTGGNISCRVGERILITRSGVSLRDMSPDDVLLVDADGQMATPSSQVRPSIETGFHLALYRLLPQINCVYHMHPVYGTLYALLEREIPLVTSVAQILLGRTPLAADAPPGSPELVEAIRAAVQTTQPAPNALLLAQHGVVTVGATLEEAYNTCDLLEDTARLAWLLENRPVHE